MGTCPYCRRPAMSFWRKCVLGPETAVPCYSCGKRVGVPWAAVAAAVPIAMGIVGATWLPLPSSIASAIGGVALYIGIQRYAVPLVGREPAAH